MYLYYHAQPPSSRLFLTDVKPNTVAPTAVAEGGSSSRGATPSNNLWFHVGYAYKANSSLGHVLRIFC